MTPPAPCRRDLADTLISHAAGLTSDTAAAELIAAHHTWLTRTDFITGHLHAGARHDAWTDWKSAVTALDTSQLSRTGSEAAILRIAVSLGDSAIPVHLARVLGSLDHRNITTRSCRSRWSSRETPRTTRGGHREWVIGAYLRPCEPTA